MGAIIAVTNQKGGVGKTMTCTSLASLLTQQGYKVLTVDLDPQRNFDMVAGDDTTKFVIQPDDYKTPSILHVLRDEYSLKETIVQTYIGDLVRASSQLTNWTGTQTITPEEYRKVRDDYDALRDLLDSRMSSWESKDDMTKVYKAIWPVRNDYDYILFDTNPSLTLVTLNAMYAADYLLIPVFSEETSYQALVELNDTYQGILQSSPGRDIRILGLLMTNCNQRTVSHKIYEDSYQVAAEKMGTRLFKTRIRKSQRAADFSAYGSDIIRLASTSTTAQDYSNFVEEFKEAIQEEERKKQFGY